MRTIIMPMALAALAATAFTAGASESGGDRERAGGAFMSSYSEGAYSNSSRTAAQAPNPGLNPRGEDVTATGSVARRRPARTR